MKNVFRIVVWQLCNASKGELVSSPNADRVSRLLMHTAHDTYILSASFYISARLAQVSRSSSCCSPRIGILTVIS